MNHHHIWRLRNLHRRLEHMLGEERRKPKPDAGAIQAIKRRKLQVKDELFMAEAGLVPVTARTVHG